MYSFLKYYVFSLFFIFFQDTSILNHTFKQIFFSKNLDKIFPNRYFSLTTWVMGHQIQPNKVDLPVARHACISVKDLIAGLVIIKAILIVSYIRKRRKQKRIIMLKRYNCLWHWGQSVESSELEKRQVILIEKEEKNYVPIALLVCALCTRVSFPYTPIIGLY